jgi:hypothetical protein
VRLPAAVLCYAGMDRVVVAVIDSGVEVASSAVGAALWTNAAEVAGDGIDNDGNGAWFCAVLSRQEADCNLRNQLCCKSLRAPRRHLGPVDVLLVVQTNGLLNVCLDRHHFETDGGQHPMQ